MQNTIKSLLFASALATSLLAETNGTARAQEKSKVQVQDGGGARITQVYAGWPATRCRTFGGRRPASLEEGDIIVGVDGTPIRTVEDLGEALQQSRGVARLDVIDFNTNRRIALLVRPVCVNGFKKIGVDAETVTLPLGPNYKDEPAK